MEARATRIRLAGEKRTEQVERLAREFSRLLLACIGRDNLDEVVRLNRSALYKERGCCASHDFCDANMVMHEAWTNLFGATTPIDFEADSSERDEAFDLWNTTWDLAKDAEFDSSKI